MACRTETGVEVRGGVTISQKQYEDGHQNKLPGFEKPYDQLEDCPDPEDNLADSPARKDVPVVDPQSGDDTQPGDADLGP